jgi:hypothetical protein
MRLPEPEVARYQWLAANLRLHADTFLGVPGMHSLYAWSGCTPPLPFYPHHWVLFRRAGEEERLVRALLAAPRPCIVRNAALEDFWLHSRPDNGPVQAALDADFRFVGAAGDYELFLPRTAAADLVLSVTLAKDRAQVLARHGAAVALWLSLPAIAGSPVVRIAVVDGLTQQEWFDSRSPDAGRRLIVTDAAGKQLLDGPEAPALDTSRPSKVLLLCPTADLAGGADRAVVRALDARGRIVARLVPVCESR